MTLLSVDELWCKISEKMRCNRDKLKKLYSKPKDYTTFLTKILCQIGYENYGDTNLEYWPRVDISFFDNSTNTKWEPWAREVAIEIENDSTDWQEELDKLFAINAGIKVLISYDDSSDNETLKYLNGDFLSIYKSRKYHQEKDNYLLIFGPTSIVNNDRKDFSAFIFNGQEIRIANSYNIFGND